MNHITLSIIEMVIAFLMASGTVWASNKILPRVLEQKEEASDSTEQSTASAVVFASVVIGASLIAVQATQVIGTTLNAVGVDLTQAVTHSLAFAAMAVFFALLTVFFSMTLTMGLTKNDESDQIANNQVGVAVALGAVIIATSMFVAPAVRGLLVNLIPYERSGISELID